MIPWNMLEIIHEGDDMDDFRMREGRSELDMAYRKGCEYGYRKAMMEMRGGIDFREGGNYGGGGYSGGTSRMGERYDYPSYPYMDEIGERRRRDSRGRYM